MAWFSISGIRPRIRPHLATLAFVAVVCVVLAVLAALRIQAARERDLRTAKSETADLVRSLAQQADDLLAAADAVLVGARQRIEMSRSDQHAPAWLHDFLAIEDDAMPSVHGFFVFDENGDGEVGSDRPGALGMNYADRPYFRWHRTHAEREAHLSGPLTSKLDGSRIMVLSRRLDHADGSFAGIVLATIQVKFFQDFYDTFGLGPDSVVALASVDGNILARRPPDPSASGSNVSTSPVFRNYLPLGRTGTFEVASSLDGKLRVGSFHQLEHFPMLVIVSRRESEVLANWRSESRTAIWQIGVLIALIVLLGCGLSRQAAARDRMEARYRLLAERSSDAIVCSDLCGIRQYVSPAFTAMTGWRAEDVIGRRASDHIHEDDRPRYAEMLGRLGSGQPQTVLEFRYACRDGTHLWAEGKFRLASKRDGRDPQVVGNIRDISDRKALEEQLLDAITQLRAISSTDGLTGLGNRRHFDEVLHREWGRALRERQPLALLLIDADCFKSYNDRMGHPAGDLVLCSIAEACRAGIRRPADLAARYGGEEFAIVLPSTDAIGAMLVAEQVRDALTLQDIPHPGTPWGHVSVSIGVAVLDPAGPGAPASAADLLERADQALYSAKRTGRNRVALLPLWVELM